MPPVKSTAAKWPLASDSIPVKRHVEEGLERSKRPRVAEENRKRAVRACDGCRRVKEKCEGGVPCRRCARYRRECLFNTVPDQNEKSSRRLRAVSLGRSDDSEAERVQYMEKILAHYAPNLSLDVSSLRKAAESLPGKQRDADSNGPPTQAEGDDPDDDDLAIDEEDFSIKAFPDNTMQYSGEYSYLNFSMKIRRKIDEWMKNAIPEDSTEAVPFEERWRATQLQSGSAAVSAAITCLPPRYVAEFLVNVAYKYARTNNFYVEEDWLRDKLNVCYTNPSSLTSNDAAAVCIILMTLAIGTQFAHMDSPTPVNKPSSDLSADEHRFSEDEVGLTFYHFASKLLPDIIATTSVRSVQACLLLGTYLLPLDTSGLSYTYFGLALKMAIQNGMHRKYTGEGLDPHMQEVRNRVFWTAFTIEKRISILHGRPASIADADVDADLPTDLPSLRSTFVPNNYTNMVALITLTMKLGEIAQEISLLRKCEKSKQSEHLERLFTKRKQLLEWWTTLPEEIECRDLNPSGPLFRCNVHLKLDYCLTRIFIGRPFLFSNVKGVNPTSAQKGSAPRYKSRSILVTDCVEAALEIVDLCRLLRDETGLARASYTEFSSCRAALLVILAQSLTKRTERLRNALSQGMGLIKIMSMGVGMARSAVNVIEALERAIRRLDEWTETQAQSRQDAVDSGYERFKNWEMLWKTGPISPHISGAASSISPEISAAPEGPPVQMLPPGKAGMETTVSSEQPGDAATKPSNHAHVSGKSQGTTDNGISTAQSPQMETIPPHDGGFADVPHFGYEGFISNFPQELDEFNAIPNFDTEAQQNLERLELGLEGDGSGPGPDGGSARSGSWISFINE
ncbi:hypothetical protein VTN49DRAFT_5481 [Thermomyces lanuginosus]|uniref:uncharacterized protein n=1 Tax=Thermomyces lanuginosus TaxID=5541 RepID=UPI003743B769